MNNNQQTPLKVFGMSVRDARKKNNLTQKELAERMGVTHEWICKIEKGKATRLSIDLIDKITNELDIYTVLSFGKQPA
jgi:transcriptional regulator with XRE-family HTH domain